MVLGDLQTPCRSEKKTNCLCTSVVFFNIRIKNSLNILLENKWTCSAVKHLPERGLSCRKRNIFFCYRPIKQNITVQIDVLVSVWVHIVSRAPVCGRTHCSTRWLWGHVPCWLSLFCCCSPAPLPDHLQNNESHLNTARGKSTAPSGQGTGWLLK